MVFERPSTPSVLQTLRQHVSFSDPRPREAGEPIANLAAWEPRAFLHVNCELRG